MRTFFLALTALFLITPLSAQAAGWVEADYGTFQSARGVAANQEVIVGAGNGGNILYTENGNDWSGSVSTTSRWWFDVEIYNEVVYVVGESGIYNTSTDNGQSWDQTNLSTSNTLYDIEISEDYGYIVGESGTIRYLSSNNWATASTAITRDLYALHDNEDATAWVVGEQGYLYYTTNGGNAWSEKGRIDDDHLHDIYFSDAGAGWVVGDNATLLLSTDAGNSWEQVSLDVLDYQDLYAVDGRGDEIVVAGDQLILYSADGGETWSATEFSEENPRTYYSIHATQEGGVWLAGTQDGVESSFVTLDDEGPTAVTAVLYFDTLEDNDDSAQFYWSGAEDNFTATDELTYYISRDGEAFTSVGTQTSYTWEDVVDGDHVFEIYAVDEFGTQGEVYEFTFTYEGEVPDESDATSDDDGTQDSATPEPGNLIKLSCAEEVATNDPCKAVYYYADDGKRHAFPNEKVFFTWFEDFNDVVEVEAEFMASLTLGANVTYRPGSKLVKFQSDPTVYAVSIFDVLLPIASEQLAEEIYGENWNQQIDDIPDTFITNYLIADEGIDEASDYDLESELYQDWSLDDNF